MSQLASLYQQYTNQQKSQQANQFLQPLRNQFFGTGEQPEASSSVIDRLGLFS